MPCTAVGQLPIIFVVFIVTPSCSRFLSSYCRRLMLLFIGWPPLSCRYGSPEPAGIIRQLFSLPLPMLWLIAFAAAAAAVTPILAFDASWFHRLPRFSQRCCAAMIAFAIIASLSPPFSPC
jgi:hypothetical protein